MRVDKEQELFEGLVEVEGRRQYVRIRGRGEPVVVFDSGCGGDSSNWTAIADQIATLTRVISYDRLGCGASDVGTAPRSSSFLVEELRALLRAMGVAPPYVLVGLSFGGLNMRLFAKRYPGEVAGLVLLEPAHEALSERMPTDYWRYELAQMARLQGAARAEAEALELSARELRDDDNALPEVPLIVVTAGRKWGDTPADIDRHAVDQAWRSLHEEIAQGNGQGEHWFVEESGHNLHRDAPQHVVRAIRQVVTRASRSED